MHFLPVCVFPGETVKGTREVTQTIQFILNGLRRNIRSHGLKYMVSSSSTPYNSSVSHVFHHTTLIFLHESINYGVVCLLYDVV